MKTTDTIEDDGLEGLPARHIEACLEHLRAARYAPRTLKGKQRILTAFADWMTRQNIGLAGLDETVMAEFRKRSTHKRRPGRMGSRGPSTKPNCETVRFLASRDHPF